MAPLNQEEFTIVERILIEDEGIRKFPYLDCCGLAWRKCVCQNKGKLTIGVGRNLDDVGISDDEITNLQVNDVKKITLELEKNFRWFQSLNTPRRIVIVSMAFNLGIPRLKDFKKMIEAIESGNFELAAIEMLHSSWSKQVKDRAKRLAVIMMNGQI